MLGQEGWSFYVPSVLTEKGATSGHTDRRKGEGKEGGQCSFSFTQINRFRFFRFSSGKLSVPGPCLPLQSRNLVRRQGSGRWSATSPKTTGSPSFPSPSTLTATAAAPARIRPMSGALRVPPVSGTGRVSKQTATGSHEERTPPLNDGRRVSALKGQSTRSPRQRRGFDPLENIKPSKGRAMMKALFRMDRAC